MQQLCGAYVTEKGSGRQGVIEGISGQYVHVVWDDPRQGFVRQSIPLQESSRVARVQVLTEQRGWQELAATLYPSQVRKPLLQEGKKKKKDCNCGCSDCQARDASEGATEEDILMPPSPRGERRWSEDPVDVKRFDKKVLLGDFGEQQEESSAVGDVLEEWDKMQVYLAEKTHSPFKTAKHLGLGGYASKERKEKIAYDCEKDWANFEFSPEEEEIFLRRLRARKAQGHKYDTKAVRPYKQFCIRKNAEVPAATAFTVNAKPDRPKYMRDYNEVYLRCVSRARNAIARGEKLDRTRDDGKPNCGQLGPG